MKPLPIHLRGAALGLAALVTLSSAAALNAAWRHLPQATNAHLAEPDTDTDTDISTNTEAGCEVNPLNLC